MTSIDDYSFKRAILCSHVSGEEHRKKGYSPADQRDALRGCLSCRMPLKWSRG